MITKLNGKYIGFPCTPSRWISNPKYEKISCITMSCDGGMGGSKWYEHVQRINDIPSNTIQEYQRIDGKRIKLNSAYIVKIEDYTLVTAEYETSNSNYYPENECLGSNVPYTKWVPQKVQFRVEDGQKVILIDEYADTAKRMNRKEGWE